MRERYASCGGGLGSEESAIRPEARGAGVLPPVAPDFLVESNPNTTLVPFMDLAGLMIYGDRERSAQDQSRFFEQAGFRMARSWPLPGRQVVYEALGRLVAVT